MGQRQIIARSWKEEGRGVVIGALPPCIAGLAFTPLPRLTKPTPTPTLTPTHPHAGEGHAGGAGHGACRAREDGSHEPR